MLARIANTLFVMTWDTVVMTVPVAKYHNNGARRVRLLRKPDCIFSGATLLKVFLRTGQLSACPLSGSAYKGMAPYRGVREAPKHVIWRTVDRDLQAL